MSNLADLLKSDYYTKPFYQRDIADGREIIVTPRMFNAIITIGPKDAMTYDTHWCYDNPVQAKIAAEAWDPMTQDEPDGWFRHADSGRRRPNGDPEKEYINP
jgi:hypothetical protein